jgi:hypothetical protein
MRSVEQTRELRRQQQFTMGSRRFSEKDWDENERLAQIRREAMKKGGA